MIRRAYWLAVFTVSLATACGGQQAAEQSESTQSTPAWCEPSQTATIVVSGTGFTAWFAQTRAEHLLFVRGELVCPLLRDVSRSLLDQLAACDAPPCGKPLPPDDIAGLDMAGAEMFAVDISGVEVIVSIKGDLSLARWPASVPFEKLAAGFQFGPPNEPTGATTALRPTPPSTDPAASTDDCLAVPCLPNNCGSTRDVDRDTLSTTQTFDRCDRCPDPHASECASVTQSDCTCYDECCKQP